ncbi:hypothetical protein INR49_011246 [Caranx melampygus]|nr:hypothetical protein INR49_011246 [Caranx melampygus]
MMSKKQRWHETLVKTNTPAQKKGGKDPSAVAAPGASKQTSKPYGRSNSLNNRGGDWTVSGSKAGGSLKTGSNRSSVGHQGSRPTSDRGRAALRLCSSRSFSSLNTSSLTAAPFMRSSHSLSRLDQTSTGQEQSSQQKSAVSESAEVCKPEHPKSCLEEHKHSERGEESHQQQEEQESRLQPEQEQRSADENSALSPIGPLPLVKEGDSASCCQCPPPNDVPPSSPEQALALQRLQKMNHDLRMELEAQTRSQEEAREAELRRRVDLLAQQAQLLVTGDATALAQAHLEQDRRRFHEQQVDWERCVSSLKSQLNNSEEQRREAESRLTQLQQELQNCHSLQQEANRLQEQLQEMKAQLCANEEAQAQKEARLQKHLMLLQASQDRERRSLAASLAQAEQHSQDLQERLHSAEEQVESLNKTQAWTREIEEAQQQLQEELARTVSAVEKLQEERDQLERRCQELQQQLSEADGEVNRLQSRLKTEETHYYNLEHSYERACEELQVALGKVQQWESETQEMREGYERLLDRKEQELSEVLLKMEVLGNSLEETEVNGNHSHELVRSRSRSIDLSYQYIVTAGDDPERFMSVIQLLETKLYVTEEKLRDITQRLEEQQSHVSCQDPLLCSQLTQSRATAQHLSLLLHSQAKQSQRFAQETESRCRTLAGRFQVALNITQACRERLQATPINIIHLEKQLATVAACLQQGQRDAERQQHEAHNANKGEDKILNDVTLAGADSNICARSKLTDMSPSEDDMQYEEEEERKRKSLEDISPPELAPYEEHVKAESRGLEEAAKPVEKDQSNDKKMEAEKEAEWLERLVSRLQSRAKLLKQLCQEICDGPAAEISADYRGEDDPAVDMNWMQEHAKLIYLSHRLQLDFEQQNEVLQKKLQAVCKEQDVTLTDEQEAFNQSLCQLREDNNALRQELERAEQKILSADAENQRLLEDIQKIEEYHEERSQKLETKFQEKIRELQQIHEEEMKHLHDYYTKEKQAKTCTDASASTSVDQAVEGKIKEELGSQVAGSDAVMDRDFAALEDRHRKLIGNLQQQHQTEMAAILKEKDQLLQQETAATMAAIVALRRAHRQELERSRQSQLMRESADMTQLHMEYEKEIQILHKELEVLSVILRAREAEMQFLRQEARSLREELKIARMDKIYAQNKLKTLYKNIQDDSHHNVNEVSEDLKFARGLQAETLQNKASDSMTNSGNAAFLKKNEKSSLTRQIRVVRSKSLKEGLSVQERMKLFESF